MQKTNKFWLNLIKKCFYHINLCQNKKVFVSIYLFVTCFVLINICRVVCSIIKIVKGDTMKELSNTSSALKKLALDAKNRLKHCTYKNKEENQNIKRNIAFQNHIRMVMESECKKPEITIKVINDYAEKEAFQNRVYALLSQNEDCINPLKELSDSKLIALMTEREKQRYIFDLSERYNKVRDDYYKAKGAYM